jgi:hypothetical protein
MRHLQSFIILTSFLFFACCNGKDLDLHKKLKGNWELKKSSKRQNNVLTYLPIKRTVLLCFTDSTYTIFSDSNMISMGRYRIIADTIRLNGEKSFRLIFKPEVFSIDSNRYFITIKNDDLTISEDSANTKTWFYERIK